MTEEEKTATLPSDVTGFLGMGERKTSGGTSIRPPSFAVGTDDFDDHTKKERRARFKASADMLFSTDVSKLDDAGASALYQSVTEGLFGLPDEDGTVAFGKRASKDPRANIDMLRKFVKGDYTLIEDPEYTKWRQMDDEAKFKYAREQETTGNKIKSNLKGERGFGISELAGAGMPGAQFGNVFQNMEAPNKSDVIRRTQYETLTDEEKAAYRADVVADYDKKLSRRQTLATFLQFAHGLSDRAGYLLAKSFSDGTPDAANIEGLPEDERDRVYAAFSLMRGDQKKGRILGIQTDFTDGTWMNRVQLGLYGFQQSVVGLVTDTGEMARDATMWTYAKLAMDEQERKDFFRGWDAIARAEQAMKQNLPEADSLFGEAFQGLAENIHWFIPYSMIGKGGKLAKGAQATIARAKLQKEVAEGGLTLAKAAAEASRTRWLADVEGAVKAGKGAKRLSEFSSAIAMRRQLAAVDQYTAALREIKNVVKAAKWKDAAGAGMWAAGEASAFSAFASEYIANADAAGISREESVLTAAVIGLINAKIEQLYVPGLESSLAPAQIKSLTFAAMAQAIKTDGAAGFRKWLANRVSKGVTEGVKVTLTEGAVEEPLQQMAIEHGKAFDKLCQELRKDGNATLANEAKALWDSFVRTLPNDYATFIDTAADMVPSSLGFGVTTIGNMTRRQHIHNAMTRHANRRAGSTSTMMTARTMQELQGATDYDAGIVDVIQQAVNVRAAVEKHWQGGEDGGEAENPHRFEEAITAARRAWRDPQTGDAVQEIANAAGVDVKTAEVLAQYLQTEAEATAFSPQARAWTSLKMSLADIDEATIKTVLPGYVEGSFASDPENGIYSGRVRMDDGTEKTIAYRVGDWSEIAREYVEEQIKDGSNLGKSFDARQAEAGNGTRWAYLTPETRRAVAITAANGLSTGKSGIFELTDSKGEKVRVNADDIILLANGRLADIGYGAAATQGTVRHETFHSLWRFVRGTLADADVQQLAKSLGVDVTADGWENELDEIMGPQMERYASGHYVSHAVSSRFDKMLDSWAGKIINFFGQFGPKDEVRDPKTGQPYRLKGLYDSVLRGELGSGALGVEIRQVPAATVQKTENTAVRPSAIPVEVTDEDRAAKEAEMQAEADAAAEAEAANENPAPVNAAPASVNAAPAPVNAAPVQAATSENPADASVPNQTYYRIGLPNSQVKLVGRLEIRDANTGLVTSTDAGYHDRGNQNRDDRSEESRALVEKIGANPDPLQVGTVQPIANNGIVWALPNGDVIIGNHRVNGVRLGYAKGSAGNLEKFVREDAARRGIEIGADVKKPLLVFVLERIESPDDKADVHEIVRLANESQNRGFNIREQAGNDAKILQDNNLLPRMAFRADGRIDETKSGDAIGKFRQESGAQGLIAEDGSLTEEGQTRIQNAALAALLGGEGNNALLQKIMSNAGRLDMQTELRALMKMTPELMALAETKQAYDLRAPLAEALQLFTEWRDKDETSRVEKGKTRHDWREMKDGHRVRGLSWEAFMSQGDMFRKPSDEAKILGDLFAKAESLRSFDREDVESAAGKKRVIDLVSDYLADYIKNARAVNTETDDMFGGTPASRADVLAAQRATGGADGGIRFSIAGNVAASNMGIKGAGDAEAMEKAGKDREEIWRTTGWWRGKDGKWRFELPSTKMKDARALYAALIEGHNETTLGKILDAPELFEAYPQLKDTKIILSPEHNDEAGGWYDRIKNEIVLFDAGLVSLKDMPSHERDLRDTYQRVLDSDEFVRRRFADMDAFGIEHGTVEEEREYARWWIERQDKGIARTNETKIRDLANDRGMWSTFGKIIHEVQHTVQRIEGFATGASGNEDGYSRFAGEVEARNASRREARTPEERAVTPPWETEDVPADRQIVRYSVTEQRVTPEEDAAYADAVKRGDMETVRRMEREVYERMGYSDDSSYQGTSAFNGAAPSRNAYFETKAERIEAAKNGEMEDTTTLGDFRDGIDVNNLQFIVFDPRSERNADPMRQEAIRNIRDVLDGGKDTITMYRSVPADVKEGQFRNGDWITPSRAYAEDNARIHGWGKKFRVIEQEVSVEDVWWDGNDIAEWGFDDGKGSVYKNTRANRKLLGPTYDDAGNLIPLSKRFNDWKYDVRYSIRSFADGTPFVEVDNVPPDIASETDLDRKRKLVERMLKDRWQGKILDPQGVRAFFNGHSAHEYTNPPNAPDDATMGAKMDAASELEDIVGTSTNPRAVPDGESGHAHDNVKEWEHRDAIFRVDGRFYSAKVNIAKLDKVKGETGDFRKFHDLTAIKDITDEVRYFHGEIQSSPSTSVTTGSNIPKPSDEIKGDPESFARRSIAAQPAGAKGGIRYSLAPNPNLREDIAAALRKNSGGDDTTVQMKRHDEIVFSDNLPFFEFLGLPNTRVVSDVVKVRKFNIKHHLSEDQIAELPYRYNAPVAVMRDGSSGYVLLTDMMGMTDNGETKPVRIFLRPRMWKSGEVVFVATAMAENAKDEKAYYEPIIKHGLLYADENKVAGLALEEETESILRTQASGDDVLTSSDYSWWSTRISITQSSADRNGLSTPAQLLAAVAQGATKHKKELQESPDDGLYSIEAPRSALIYPQLHGMSDDDLIAAAIATRIALGKSDKVSDRSVKINTVQNYMRRLHPDWNTTKIGVESLRIISDAQKFAKRIREDLDRGVSESLILEHLPDTMQEQFGREMRQEAREGARLGAFGARANAAIKERQAQIVEDAVRVQTGLDSVAIENAYGINLSETIMHIAENRLTEKDATPGATGEGEGSADEEGSASAEGSEEAAVEIDAKVKAVVDDIVAASGRQAGSDEQNRQNRKAAAGRDAENEAAMGEGEEGSEGEGDSAGEGFEGDALAKAVKKSALDLENPRHLARFVAELARRQWVKEHHLAQDADVWRDLVAVQFLRKTAQSVYAKLCRDLVYSRSRETAMQRIARLDAVPTVAGLLSEMEFVGALINAKRIRDTQKQLCKKLDLFLRQNFGAKGRFKPDKEEGKRKVSAEAELRARYMRNAMWLTPDAAAEEARQLQETLDALAVDFKDAGRDRDQSREFVETIRKLNVLREFGALRYKPVGEIEAAIQWWQDFARGESDDIVREMSDRDIRTKKAAHLLAVAFADPKRTTIREGGKADALNRFITGHMGFISLLQDCMRHASDADASAVKDIIDYISREIQKAGDRSAAEKRRHNDAFHSAVESIYGKGFNAVMKDMMAQDDRFAKFMGVVGGKRVTPTKGRALQLLVSLLQEGRKIEVEDEENPGQTKTVWEGGYHDNIVKHHREGQAAEIMRLLDPADMNMLKWLGQWYENNRSDLSQVCHSLFGIGVYAELPNYFPVKMQLETQGLEKGNGVGWTIFPKALTPRVRNERDFDTSADIFSMWASRMEDAAQWKHHAKLGLEMRGIFGRAELREAVRANHGASVDDLMQGFITDILAGHGAYDRSTAGVQYFSDQIRGWTALCALGGNVGVMAKQPTSIPAFGFEIGLVNTAKYMVSAFTPEGMAAMAKIWDSEQRRTRWQVGSSEAVRNALSQQNAGALKRMFQASMITNKLGDVVPALVVGQGIYRDCLARGMSEEDAMAETWSIVERTQQSGRMENQTSIQRRNKLGRIMFQFLSTQQQYLQYEVRAIREVIARPDSVKRWGGLGRAILLNHFILSSAYFWMGQLYKYALGQEPPEDELKDWVITCLLGPYGSLFVAGFCCKYTLERAIKGYSIKGGSSMLPMESWLKNQVNDGAKLLEAIFDSDGDTWDNMLEAAGRWMSDSNSTVRDLRKLYRYRVKGEQQKK